MSDTSQDYLNFYQNYSGAGLTPTATATVSTTASSGSWLSNLFAKKEGGTFVGNLLRAASSNLSGGILGQGKNMVNADGSYGNGDNSGALADVLATVAKLTSQTPQGQQVLSQAAGSYAASTVKDNSMWLIIVGFMGVIMAMILITKK